MRRTAILAGLLALIVAAPASAHHHGLRIDTVASGLDNPRHVARMWEVDEALQRAREELNKTW